MLYSIESYIIKTSITSTCSFQAILKFDDKKSYLDSEQKDDICVFFKKPTNWLGFEAYNRFSSLFLWNDETDLV